MRPFALPALTVVLDTQVLLRGAPARTQSLAARIHEAWCAGESILLVSEPILAEVDAVTARPDIVRKLRVTAWDARAVLFRLRRRARLVRPEVVIRLSRDPADSGGLAGLRDVAPLFVDAAGEHDRAHVLRVALDGLAHAGQGPTEWPRGVVNG